MLWDFFYYQKYGDGEFDLCSRHLGVYSEAGEQWMNFLLTEPLVEPLPVAKGQGHSVTGGGSEYNQTSRQSCHNPR